MGRAGPAIRIPASPPPPHDEGSPTSTHSHHSSTHLQTKERNSRTRSPPENTTVNADNIVTHRARPHLMYKPDFFKKQQQKNADNNYPREPTIPYSTNIQEGFTITDGNTIRYSSDLPSGSFFPPRDKQPQTHLPFARFENDPELLRSIQDLKIPLLINAVWRPNSNGESLCGGFGQIERAKWSNQDIAVKFLRSSHTISGAARGQKSFRRELTTWQALSHPNVLPFLGVVCVDNTYLGMVSPYMRNGSAPRYLARHINTDVLQILYDVAQGMSHLATQKPPIAHGDLKGANVLISDSGRACICDFGLSRFMKDFMSIDTNFGGTIRWMAPEQLVADTMTVSLSADIFSWGMLSLELMTGKIPWSYVQQDTAVVVKVVKGLRPPRPFEMCRSERCIRRNPLARMVAHTCLIGNDELWSLMQRCWANEPHARPNVTQLCAELKELKGDRKKTPGLSINK